MTIESKDIVSIYRLGSISDTDPKNRPIFVKFVNTTLKLELMKNAFHLKNTTQLVLTEPSKYAIAIKHF